MALTQKHAHECIQRGFARAHALGFKVAIAVVDDAGHRWGRGGAAARRGGGGRPPPITTTRSPTKPRDTPSFPRVIRSDRRAPDSASGAPGSSSTPPSVVPASRYPLQ